MLVGYLDELALDSLGTGAHNLIGIGEAGRRQGQLKVWHLGSVAPPGVKQPWEREKAQREGQADGFPPRPADADGAIIYNGLGMRWDSSR